MSQGTDEEVRRFIISGHSGDTDEKFEIPRNTTIQYYADENMTCYVPNDEESLNMIITEMDENKNEKIYMLKTKKHKII